jgi:hypothetical protein
VLLCVTAAITGIVIIYIFRKWRTKKKSRLLHRNIFALPGTNATEEMESSGKSDTDTMTNLYTGSRSGIVNNLASNRTRLDSHYLRQLTVGNVLVKSKQLTQLENIGQGIYVL